MWPTEKGRHCGCTIGEPDGVLKWPTQMVELFGIILVN
jgi:hypothetical protein